MKLDVAIESVQDAEASLAKELRRAGERHALQSDLYHLTRMLADRCEQQLERLLPFATRYGAPDTHDPGESSAVVEQVRRLGGELAGRHEASGLVLLDDLRGLYVSAQEAEISWTVLIQGALAIRIASSSRSPTSAASTPRRGRSGCGRV